MTMDELKEYKCKSNSEGKRQGTYTRISIEFSDVRVFVLDFSQVFQLGFLGG